MRQHPIPQDITNYKFHLIGNMTLKQFGELAGGVIIALIIYSTNLIAIVKWPLIFFIVGLAVLVAFVPIEERPLDHWIITFFKNLWKPTKFYWKKKTRIPDCLNYELGKINKNPLTPEVDLNPARKKRIYDYLNSIPKNEELDAWDLAENKKINQLIEGFDSVIVENTKIEVKKDNKPTLKTRVRKLKAPSRIKNRVKNKSDDLLIEETEKEKQVNTNIIFEKKDKKPLEEERHKIKSNKINNKKDGELEVKFEKEVTTAKQEGKSIESRINKDLPIPSRPEVPNKIAGMVFNQEGKIVPAALIEIKDKAGQSKRIVKSNDFGQFFIRTPLENGEYQIHTENSNYKFHPFNLELSGKIVAPIEIRANS